MAKASVITCFLSARLASAVIGLIFCFFYVGYAATPVEAAALSLSPAKSEYRVGDTFTVNAIVESSDQAMNAIQAVISFPEDRLQAMSVAKSGSIINLWVQEPAVSNAAGTVNLEGVVFNPGFTGNSAQVLAINFKVIAEGEAVVRFASGAVLANDGKGTNILSRLASAAYDLRPAGAALPKGALPPEAQLPEVQEVQTGNAPARPRVTSASHPDQTVWYANNNTTFEWPLPRAVIGVNVLADRLPETNPGNRSDGLFRSYTYAKVADGVWRFHIRFQNASGWGPVAHYKFQIDTAPPEISAVQFVSVSSSAPQAMWSATDATSGVAYYEIQADGGEKIRVEAHDVSSVHPYVLPPQTEGTHTFFLRAFDRAGNYALARQEFTVVPPAPEAMPAPLAAARLTISLPALFAALLFLLTLSLLAHILVWHITSRHRYRLRNNIHRAEDSLHKAFDLLRANVVKQLHLLEKIKSKRALTKEEEIIATQLQKELDRAEELIRKDMENIGHVLR